MRIQLKMKYGTYPDADLRFRFYGDESTSLELVEPSGERITVASICLMEFGLEPGSPDRMFINPYEQNHGILDALMDAGVIEPGALALGLLPNGISFPLCQLTPAAAAARALDHLPAEGPAN